MEGLKKAVEGSGRRQMTAFQAMIKYWLKQTRLVWF